MYLDSGALVVYLDSGALIVYLDSGALIVYLYSGALIMCLDSGALQTDLVRRHLPDSAFSLSQLNRLSRGLILF